MKVSFNPTINNNTSFGVSYYAHKLPPKPMTTDEIRTAKIKKVVSELKYLAIGAGIIYFGAKKAFKMTRMKNAEERLAKKLQVELPKISNLFKK